MTQDEIDEREWNDPANWRGGWLGIYSSARDSRTIVPKRQPWWGWTVNLARPGGKLFVALVAALVLAIVVLVIVEERAR